MTQFVTSFSPDLYEASGRRLIDSFLKVQTGTGNRLLLCSEGMQPDPAYAAEVTAGRLAWRPLDQDELLLGWLKKYAGVIPEYLGGTTKECSCPGREKRHAKHRPRCHWQWMNRNASRWFRKVPSLAIASREPGGRTGRTIWLDADAHFVEASSDSFWDDLTASTGFVYCRGHRPAVESGIMAFSRDGLPQVVAAMADRYVSGRFVKDERWDDGYQFARLIDEDIVKGRDLVHPTRYAGKTNDVIPTTVLHRFLRHEKGRHGTKLDIMK